MSVFPISESRTFYWRPSDLVLFNVLQRFLVPHTYMWLCIVKTAPVCTMLMKSYCIMNSTNKVMVGTKGLF